jgi:hypothetical protein
VPSRHLLSIPKKENKVYYSKKNIIFENKWFLGLEKQSFKFKIIDTCFGCWACNDIFHNLM